jgi:hypothetical protein
LIFGNWSIRDPLRQVVLPQRDDQREVLCATQETSFFRPKLKFPGIGAHFGTRATPASKSGRPEVNAGVMVERFAAWAHRQRSPCTMDVGEQMICQRARLLSLRQAQDLTPASFVEPECSVVAV